MSYFSIPLLAGQPYKLESPGRLVLVDSLGAADSVDITLIVNGAEGKQMPSRKTAFRLVANFDGVILQTSVDATVGIFLSFDDVQLGVSDGASVKVPDGVLVTNTDAEPVPVRTPVGAPLEVNFAGTVAPVLGDVTVINTTAEAIPVIENFASTVTNGAPVAVTDVAGVLIAASAARRGLRIKNVGANPVAIGGAGVVYANAAVLIQAGETWNENEAPGAAWYCICDTGLAATLNIQTIA